MILTGCLLLFTSVAIAQQDSIKKLRAIDRTRERNIDVKHIAIDLRFDWQKKQAYGSATITAAPLHAAGQIALDAGMLAIHSIVLKSGAALKYKYDASDKNDNLLIMLDRSYAAGEHVTVKINYHTNYVNETDPNNLWGSYGKGIRFFQPSFTDPRKRKQIWSAGMPESNRYWFPCYDSPDDFRTTEFTATVGKEMSVISNGKLLETKENSDSTHSFYWKMETPYANHQTSFVVGEYVDIKENYNGIEIHNYSYPDEVEAVKASTERLTDMMKYFSEKTGTKFPYPNYNQVFVQEFPWGGGHNMNTSTLSDNMIDDHGTHADFLYLWDVVEGNDLAAQWFGNLLTPKSWEHSWLNKSFATYFSGLYCEYKNGLDEFQLWLRPFNQTAYINDWYAGIRRPVVTNNYDDPVTMVSDNYALYRGAEVLHMLRKHLGEDNWWKAISHYVRSNANRPVTTDDFLKAIEISTGEKMDWFFDQWLYKTGHPVFEVTKKYDAGKKQLSLKISQTQIKDSVSAYPQSVYFKGRMEIEIDGRIEQVWIEPKAENAFIFQSAMEPRMVNVDYGSTWIKEIKFEKPLDELLYQFQNDKDITGRNTAMAGLVSIAKSDSISSPDKQKIVTAFQEVVSSNLYWRFRSVVLGQLRGILKAPYDEKTLAIVQSLIKEESSWLRSSAIFFLASTNDMKYAPLYISYLNDKSDRVVNAAAFALAKTKNPKAFDVLFNLKDKPSWKNQSLMSVLNAMKSLGDPRTVEIALNALKDNPAKPRWTLANNSWDYRVVAAETLVAFGKGNEGYPVVLERFKRSMEENDINDIFNNVMLTAILATPEGQEIFDAVKIRFKDDPNALKAVGQYEEQFKEAIKK